MFEFDAWLNFLIYSLFILGASLRVFFVSIGTLGYYWNHFPIINNSEKVSSRRVELRIPGSSHPIYNPVPIHAVVTCWQSDPPGHINSVKQHQIQKTQRANMSTLRVGRGGQPFTDTRWASAGPWAIRLTELIKQLQWPCHYGIFLQGVRSNWLTVLRWFN